MLPVYDIPMQERVPDYPIAKAFEVQWRRLEGIALFRKKYVSLPGEIRNKITAYIVVKPHPIGMDVNFTCRAMFPSRAAYDWTYFLQAMNDRHHGNALQHEVQSIYYTGNTFEFYHVSHLIRWIKGLWTFSHKLVKNVNLHFRSGDPTKALKLLVKTCPNIKNLEFSIEDFDRNGRHDYERFRSPLLNAQDFFYGTHQEIKWGDIQNLGTTSRRSIRSKILMPLYVEQRTQNLKDFRVWWNDEEARVAKKKKLRADEKARKAAREKRLANKKKRALDTAEVHLPKAL